MSFQHAQQEGFTLVELLVVLAILGLLIGMLLPGTRRVREGARRTACLNNVRQLALAIHNYESAHKRLPPAAGRLIAGSDSDQLSGFVHLAEYMDLGTDHTRPQTIDGVEFPAGPSPTNGNFPLWKQELSMLRCASAARDPSDFGQTNYAFCIGDMARDLRSPSVNRGAFACQRTINFADCTDGMSNTLALSEIELSYGNSSQKRASCFYFVDQPVDILEQPELLIEKTVDGLLSGRSDETCLPRGSNWARGVPEETMFNTILPPKSPSGRCENGDGIFSASSMHNVGLNVAMLDGSTRYLSSSIDCGDSSKPSPRSAEVMQANHPSPYGVWGALGAINDGGDHDW